MYEAVQGELDIETDPPAGLVFHWVGEVDGKWTVVHVWEARENYDLFREERLFPAIRKISGMDPPMARSRRSASSRFTTT